MQWAVGMHWPGIGWAPDMSCCAGIGHCSGAVGMGFALDEGLSCLRSVAALVVVVPVSELRIESLGDRQWPESRYSTGLVTE